MDKVQSRDMESSTPDNGLDSTGSNVSEVSKTMENCLSVMQPNIGFVKSTASGMVLPQFPCLMVNYKNRPGPLVTPNLVPMRPVAHAFDIQSETPNPAQRLDSDGHKSDSDTMCVDYRTHADKVNQMTDCDSSKDSSKNVSVKRRDVAEKNAHAFRLNKFVRRLYDMLCNERNTGLVQWRRGLLVLLDTKVFAKQILPKYFNTRNFKTFRRQLNYYGFVHVRSYSNTGSKSTTALWVNQELATGKMSHDGKDSSDNDLECVSSVLQLKRVDTGESVKTSEGRRERKELALSTIEDDLGVSAQFIALHQLHTLCDEPTMVKSEKTMNTTSNQSLKSMLLPEILPKMSSKRSDEVSENQDRVAMAFSSYQCRGDTNGTNHALAKPPTSSVSVANLLLLLSSG